MSCSMHEGVTSLDLRWGVQEIKKKSTRWCSAGNCSYVTAGCWWNKEMQRKKALCGHFILGHVMYSAKVRPCATCLPASLPEGTLTMCFKHGGVGHMLSSCLWAVGQKRYRWQTWPTPEGFSKPICSDMDRENWADPSKHTVTFITKDKLMYL